MNDWDGINFILGQMDRELRQAFPIAYEGQCPCGCEARVVVYKSGDVGWMWKTGDREHGIRLVKAEVKR